MPVERTVSEWRDNRWQSENRRLSDFRSARAYVLLGEPGSGKTTAFEVEEKEDGNALFVPARRFIGRHIDSHPEWKDKTLFVDGLDELRARGGNPHEPLDAFLCRIEQFGQPRFRLSCREDSWLGRNDFDELASVTGDDGFHLLRLDPLGPEEARAILADKGVEHPRNFMWRVVDNGLEVFIENPLLLETLADTVASGSWPDGRLDMFERACEELAKESNERHLNAQDGRPFSTSEILLASGLLCALLLLSGKVGWSRRGSRAEDCPALSEAGDRQGLLKAALDTKLFDGSDETCRSPHHRAIGEFLAAKHLDHAIRVKHLAPGRVWAWMLGIDGLVMPDLRGVSVWLAAMNSQVRDRLIESDPIGLAFHGDAGCFSRSETQLLLDGLEAKIPRVREWPSQASLAALVAGPAREILCEMLQAADRSNTRQELVELLLRGMAVSPWGSPRTAADGSPRYTEEIREVLAALVRDPTWRSSTRHRALVALIHVVGNEADHISTLRDLLDDLAADKVPADERGDLQGELLIHLYPGHLTVDHIWEYLPSGAAFDGKARVFWTQHLVCKAPKEDVASLLNTLGARAEELIPRLAQGNLDVLVMQLLTRGLEFFGEEREVAKLYEWFELVDADYERPGLVPAHCERVALRSRHLEEQTRIYRWLRANPDIQLALVLEGLMRHATLPRTTVLDMTIGTKFLGDSAPVEFRKWCLDQAVELATVDPGPSEELASWAVTGRREEWGPVLGDDEVAAAVRDVPELRRWNEKRLAAEEHYSEMAARQRESPAIAEFRRRKEACAASVRGHLDAIQVGQGPPDMLYELGEVYVHGLEAGGPDQARDDLAFHLNTDHELVEAVIRGFRRLVDRRDLPDLNGIIRLHEDGRMSVFASPFLAGLTEDEMVGADPLQRLNDEGLGRALGFYLLSRLPTKRRPIPRIFTLEEDCRPSWYRQALRDHPLAVADAFVAVHLVRVRAKEPPDQHLHDLTMSDEYAEVARLAVPRMFTPFPSRCAGQIQLATLRQVLWAALRYMCSAALLELIQRRLDRTEMDTGQRVQWLAAGALASPEEFLPKLVSFLSAEGETRVLHLVDFLVPDTDPLPNQEWPTTHLATLIGAVGKWVRPPSDYWQDSSDRFKAVRIAETDIKAPPLVQHWIDTLAERVDEQAIAALDNLAKDPVLGSWRGQLVRARDVQAERLRIAKYRAPTLSEIRKAVDGGPPAGAADLAALVTEKLNRLADRIRNGNTDDWLQYWHTDPDDPQGRRVTKPKPEELCRDHLLSDLQLWLSPYDVGYLFPNAVDAAPEGHHAEDARSDILTVHDAYAVPVEIKKADSQDLWSAIKDQLIAKYVRDPRSDGYGIYLVLWFGPEHLKIPPLVGARPDSPDRLRQMLAEMLEPAQRRTISIVVVDVSAPRGRGP